MTHVLVVEDEPPMLSTLAANLDARGYELVCTTSGSGALKAAARTHPDIVILDLGLPDLDGLDVISGLHGWTRVPIIVISARPDGKDTVAALDAGADDYLTKPFGIGELLARLRVAARHTHDDDDATAAVSTPDFGFDIATRRAWRNGQRVSLTPIEWELVKVFAAHPRRILTHAQLLEQVWHLDDLTKTHYVRFHVAALRRKLEPDAANPRYFVTERGLGFRFEPEGAQDDVTITP